MLLGRFFNQIAITDNFGFVDKIDGQKISKGITIKPVRTYGTNKATHASCRECSCSEIFLSLAPKGSNGFDIQTLLWIFVLRQLDDAKMPWCLLGASVSCRAPQRTLYTNEQTSCLTTGSRVVVQSSFAYDCCWTSWKGGAVTHNCLERLPGLRFVVGTQYRKSKVRR
ncbi:hypothetical protein SCHPADRAFT_14646 [Schizopora paradoxa]|uniref:Uncharacterized protein n=1 Tax=Schizopora paradoxa TaxID=27342 RepID=A0A0H2SFL5_9AGAM|nr:hypothetical protein SCHPADRAFT_14646 [Schizopora paradoxa]